MVARGEVVLEGRGSLGARDGKVAFYLSPNRALLGPPPNPPLAGEAAAQVRCPVHFVLGSADQMTSPRVTRDIAQALKARIHTLPSGHCLMQEAPDAMLTALRASLA